MHQIWCSLLEFMTVVKEEDAADGNLLKNETKQKVYRVQGANIRCIILHFNYRTECSAVPIQFWFMIRSIELSKLFVMVRCRVENILQLVSLEESL